MPYDKDDSHIVAERGALLAEIVFLAYRVNIATEYCVFVDYSGHVESIRIEIAESKERYNKTIASTEFYTKYSGDQMWKITPLDALKAKRDHLKAILEGADIEDVGMEMVYETTARYEF